MNEIRSVEKSSCILCGSKGYLFYENLPDRLFAAPGEWNYYKCGNINCGLIWLNPMPVEKDISLAYKNYYTHAGDASGNSFKKKFFRKVKDEYLASEYEYGFKKFPILKNLLYLDPDRLELTKYQVMYIKNSGGNLLDIGCGSGDFIFYMNKHGWKVTGIDFDPKAVEAAKARNLDARLGSLSEQNFPSNCFDAVTLAHVIEHIYDPIVLLKECQRILKKNGKLVISTPNNESFGHNFFKSTWRGLEPPRHIHIFSKKSLVNSVKASEFSNFRCFTTARMARFIFFNSGTSFDSKFTSKVRIFYSITAKLFSYIEWFLIKMKKDCGEELILIAEK